MKIFLNSTILVMVSIAVSSCGNEGRDDHASRNSFLGERNAEICMVAPVGDGACKPNVHYFFNFPDDFSGRKISVPAFAAYSARGSLLIYPSSEFACDALEYSGIEVFLVGKIPQDVEKEIERNGVARVLVTGKVNRPVFPGGSNF
jgi:hypothetical protein